MLRKILIITAILALFVTSSSFAQLPGGKWWKLQEVAKEINLTDAQVKQIESVFLDHKKQMIDAKATLEKEQLDLESMFESDDFDEKAVTDKIDRLESARSKLHKGQLMFFVEVRKILTQEQFSTLREKREQFKNLRREKRRERRMGNADKRSNRRGGMRGEAPDDDFIDDDM